MNTFEFLSHLKSKKIQLIADGERLRCDAPKDALTPSLKVELKERKAEILAFLNRASSMSRQDLESIRPVSRQGNIPLSFAQERLWFLNQLEPNSAFYNIPGAVRLNGNLNLQILQQALDAIVAHHEILRINYISEEGKPIQVIASPQSLELQVIDLQQYEQAEETQVQKLLQQESQRPFDLASDLMLRGCLLQLAPQEYILLLVMHHIASDGWSIGILWEQLSKLYQAFSEGKSNPLGTPPIQYADYAFWQRERLSGEILNQQLNYWQQQLAGANPVLELPTDRPRPPVQSHRGASQSLTLPQSLSDELKHFCQQEGVTLYMTLLAAFQTLLYRYSEQADIIVGSPIAGRNRAEIEELIGLFLNTLILRTNFSGNPSFRQLLQQVRRTTLDAYAHQDLPFDKLVEEINPERSLSYNPLFQVLFNMLNLEETQVELPGLKTQLISVGEATTSKFDLTLYAAEKKQGIELQLVYNADLFSPERMQVLLGQLHHLLGQIVDTPDRPIRTYSLVTPSAKSLLPDPGEVLPEPDYELVTTIFSSWVNRTPEQAAICQENNTWNYSDLSRTAQTLAKVLLAYRIKKGEVVAVSGTRSFGLIASMLGVLFSGGVLLNLDPKLPKHRQQMMLQEAQAKYILYVGSQPSPEKSQDEQNIWNSLVNIAVEPSTGATLNSQQENVSITHLPKIAPDDAAYIFFTSGTTGVPKGVLGCHKGLSHFLTWQRQTFEISPQDRIGQLTAPSFDVVLRDIFLPLTSGATLCLPKEENILEPSLILSWLESEQISVFHTVPTLAQSWLTNVPPEVSLSSLRWLFFAGEPLKGTLVKQWRETFPQAGEIVNLYGPTETTLAKCCYRVPSEPISGVLSVGFPLPQTQALIFGQNNQLCGIGEAGEIVIRTPFRSLGYINSSEENSARFVQNPFTHDKQDLLYYTGDRGRYNPDGSLEILGRLDHQVKIRGVRIEPREIEVVLSQHPDLLQNIVIAREDIPGDKRLVAYIVSTEQPHSSELRSFVQERLPNYMVPSAFVFLDSIPLTPNGKVDRRALPAPDNTRQESSSTFVAPQDKLESHLTEIWSQVLNVKPIGVRDNFFDLGGNSLQAVALFAQIEKQFGKKLPLVTLFQSGTVAEIAQIIRQKKWLSPWSSLVPIKPDGTKPPLFYIHGGGGNLLVYRDLAFALGTDQPVYGLQSRGLDGRYAPFNRIEDMANHYLAQIRKLQPNGPYFLAGLSSGGTTAWEIAQLLQAQGQKVALLALFDSSGPDYYQILPPLPRLLSVFKYVISNSLRRPSLLPQKLVYVVKQLGLKQTSIKILENLGIVKKVLDEDLKINKKKMQNIFQVRLAKYKIVSNNISPLEKWINSLAIFLLKRFARGFYTNVFLWGLSGNDLNTIDLVNDIDQLPEALQKVQQANIIANRNYIPSVYSGRVILFRASDRPPGFYDDPQLGWGD
ncbi:MAG: amino acid adenylation domain-containing protein, partial [Cyanobacteria bacterium P01_A01_bin.83]